MSNVYRDKIAKTIWETSRADEGTISATGANIIADALMPLIAEFIEEEITNRYHPEFGTEWLEKK